MTAPTLFILGTPGGNWPAWARALVSSTDLALDLVIPAGAGDDSPLTDDELQRWLPAAGLDTPWGGVAEDGWRMAEALALRLPDARFAVIVESPASTLAAALQQGKPFDAEGLLARWRSGARQLLRLLQLHRGRFVLFDAAEAWAAPAAVSRTLCAHLDTPPPSFTEPDAPVPDALCDWLGNQLVQGRAELLALHRSLLGACVELDAPPATPAAPDASALVGHLLALQKELYAARGAVAAGTERQLAALQDELEHLRSTTSAREADLQARLADAEQVHARQANALEVARADEARVQQALEQERAGCASTRLADEQKLAALETEAKALRNRAREHERTEQAVKQEMAAALATQTRLRSELDAARAELDKTRREHSDTLKAARVKVDRALKDELQQQRLRGDAARHDATRLLSQLHEAQETLEVVDAERRKLEQALQAAAKAAPRPPASPVPAPKPAPPPPPTIAKEPAAPPAVPGDPSFGELRIAAVYSDPPYLGTDFSLRRVKWAGREAPTAQVRLVEHRGHPGLVVFGGTGSPELLKGWRPTGAEDDRSFQLLMPSDAASASTLATLDADDWRLLLALSSRLEAALQTLPAARRERWIDIAQRLALQLRELPPQLRWSEVTARAAADGGWVLRLERASWGLRDLPALALHWMPEAGTLALGLDGARAPLLSWPSNAEGLPPQEHWLPLGKSAPLEARELWQRLPLGDKDFAAAVVRRWPAIVAGIRWPSGQEPPGLPQATDRIGREAAQLLPVDAAQLTLAGLALRVMRRLDARRGSGGH
ncbi:MAG: hypothetical protein ING89_15390 [Rubrivivax sp.]|nr:hypothetical protein [Rubrivivax sp.]